MTKIMTAYTVVRLLSELNIQHPENMYLRVSKKAATMVGTTAYLRVDYRINIYDCLHALLLPSGNDAAVVLATALGKWLYFSSSSTRKPSPMKTKSRPPPDPSSAKDPALINFEYGHDEYIHAFVCEMNRQAKRLGLDKVNFANPHGLSEKANHASP
mmetsp:Transcript_20661/g.15200  ORF Transcript_20661/g.15200 Transcript_20661/m.15200 type:complete len:157 (+) Transcript_20661:908-1378(+)